MTARGPCYDFCFRPWHHKGYGLGLLYPTSSWCEADQVGGKEAAQQSVCMLKRVALWPAGSRAVSLTWGISRPSPSGKFGVLITGLVGLTQRSQDGSLMRIASSRM